MRTGLLVETRDFFKSHLSLILAVGFSSLAIAGDVPIWAAGAALFFWIWKLTSYFFRLPSPSKKITGAFAFVFFILIYLEFKTFLGKESATSFIIILTSLKILEFTEDIEKDFIVLLGFFLTTAKFLFSYDLFYLTAAIPIYFILTYNLLPSSWTSNKRALSIKYLLKVFSLTLPISLVVFTLFPRITKTLTELNIAGNQGISGFSDRISPGSISQLSLSNEVALRIEMDSAHILKPKDIYIKGAVLEKNIGQMNWGIYKLFNLQLINEKQNGYDYKITIEPTNRLHLFSLYNTKMLNSEAHRVFVDANNTFRTDSIIERRASFRGFFGNRNPPVSEEIVSINKEIDKIQFSNETLKKRVLNLISEIKSKNKRHHEINSALLNFFKSNNYQYTLSPGINANLNIDSFLFQSKKGYCEHFAAAHASLLRLAGVPARVVIGYQGGEFNPVGNFWTLRQKDAHAWVEYLSEAQKWVLTDPISVIAPQRIELGSELFSSIANDMLTVQEIESKVKTRNYINNITMWFENINYQWNSFLLDFDFEKQKELFQKYKISASIAVSLVLFLFAILSIIFQKITKAKIPISYSEKSFEILQNWAAKSNLQKQDPEGPIQWQERILKSAPGDTSKIKVAFDSWIKICYQNLDREKQQTEFFAIKNIMKELK